MPTLDDHPTVRAIRGKVALPQVDTSLDAAMLRELVLRSGADDVGFVGIDRPEVADQRADILAAFPGTRTLIAVVCRMNRGPVRNPNRSVSNLEFHETTDHVNAVCRAVVRELEATGIPAINPPAGFPMDMTRFPGKVWVVSHKPVAVAAGLGRMGIHRNVIHPRFGNFILLGTILLGVDASEQSYPIDCNPCLECKLCVAACPVGAIAPDGHFDVAACMNHNYREFMSGFTDWVETVVESRSKAAYRAKVTDPETASVWQSLAFGPNYKAAYCLAVCPAGEEVISPFLADRGAYLAEVVKPLQQKEESLYVVPGSDAEEYAGRKYPHKPLRRIGGIRPATIRGFVDGMKLVFQRGRAAGLDATYHFTFTGREPTTATVVIRAGTIDVRYGLHNKADCAVTADSDAWLGFLRKERWLLWALIRRSIRVKGSPRLLAAFGRCFPG